MISIVTTSYNYSEYIEDTIKSVLAQTYCDWELIVVDDASSDNSVEVIKSFKDDRIKLFVNEKNLGLKETTKRAISYCHGEWIAFLESDDSWQSDTIEKRINVAKSYSDVDVIFNDVNLFGDENRIKMMSKNVEKTRMFLKNTTFPKNIYKEFVINNIIMTFSSVMIKRHNFKNINWNTPIDALLDWWLYIHITKSGEAFYIDEKLTNWRMHKMSYINNHSKKFASVSISAYYDLAEKRDILFLIKSTICYVLFRIYLFIELKRILIIRKIKDVLGIPKKDSPLFDD